MPINNFEPFAKRIREDFPNFQFAKIEFGGEGEDHTVLLVDDEWIFRFRKSTAETGSLEDELNLLVALKGKTVIKVPDYEMVSRNKDFGGYKMIRGSDLTVEQFLALTPEIRSKLAKQLGEFLSILHGLPTDIFSANALQPLDIRDPAYYARRFKNKRRPEIAPAISAELLNDIDNFYEKFSSMESLAYKITQGDLQSDHILLAPSKDTIAGIIDFTDAAVWDPARDFAFFWGYGEDIVNEIYANYVFHDDPDFLNRSKWQAARLFIDRLYYDLYYAEHAELDSDQIVLERVIKSLK
jgi:aminoglycoside 2''-phosphotransferase